MSSDFTYFALPPPRCPNNSEVFKYVQYPTVSGVFFVISVTSLLFAIIITFKYNSVKVFNKHVTTSHIWNTIWIYYFATIALRAATECIRYILPTRIDGKTGQTIFFLVSLVLHGVTSLTLTWALNHQRKYRSATLPQREEEIWFKKMATPSDFVFLLIFVLYCVCLLLMEVQRNSEALEFLFLGAFGLQHLPIIFLTLMVAFARYPMSNEGPTTRTRCYLLIASFFNVAGDIPISILSHLLPGQCVYGVASYVDLFHFCFWLSLFFYFFFLRAEYFRNQEEAVWTTVSKIQDPTFDFRKFDQTE